MELTIDQGVKSLLNGLNLNKYLPLFEEYCITMEILMSLNEEDLKIIGVEDQEDIKLILKYTKKFQHSFESTTTSDLTLEEVRRGIQNVEEHLQTIDAAVSYSCDKLAEKKVPIHDSLVDEIPLTEIIEKTTDRVEKSCYELNSIIQRLIQNSSHLQKKSSQFSWKIPLTLFTSIAVVALILQRLK